MASFLLMKSINKLLRNKQIYQNSKQSISYLLTKLKDKKLIRINGKDSYDYIQGLVQKLYL
jgi:folate-binding Fe-S cluster repair protein YgfZ